jgi:hypothetical protein
MVKTDQADFERRIKIVKEIATRQSDRDIPKTPFNNGATSLVNTSGKTGAQIPQLPLGKDSPPWGR